ncbi:MAG: 16S rRNA (adenine(1518)-N(6)/adenine(1519)-N(6))-dimethyltransferase RsmA [Candidatus Heimdallarchaeaceae archaeon]|jgi:16S rRNA (adenine1518-N6/adenine1519-N6)-dimethyltransferase
MECWDSSSELRRYVLTNLKQLGVKPSQHKGQNFLIDTHILRYQVEQAEVNSSDVVLEIGGGLGNLTKCLASKAKKVYVIELDKRFGNFLKEEFQNLSNIEIIIGDAVKVEFPSFTKCVSNLPYQISSPITFKLLSRSFKKAILMYQKDFAERIFAQPGSKDYSRLSVMMTLRAHSQYLKTVKPSSFYPSPQVQSAIVSLEAKEVIEVKDVEDFSLLINLLFSHKKKVVRSILNNLFKRKEKSDIILPKDILDSLQFADRRVFTLTLKELIDLYQSVKQRIGEDKWLNIISPNMK